MKRQSLLFISGFVFAILASGSLQFARAASQGEIISACADKRSGNLRLTSAGKCRATERSIAWNVRGVTGAVGETGDQGLQGPRGLTGEAGPSGTPGRNGDQGPRGEIGPQGQDGAQGPAGPMGPTGPTGPTGLTGATGATGPAWSPPSYNVGDLGPAGGRIFITPATLGNTTGRYFEAAPNTWSGASSDPTGIWCNSSGNITSYTGTLGDGARESSMIIRSCTSSAADTVDAFSLTANGVTYSDWYLPTSEEINLMYTNRSVISPLSSGEYWSTTTDSSSGGIKSLALTTTTGVLTAVSQGSTAFIRPIRSFEG